MNANPPVIIYGCKDIQIPRPNSFSKLDLSPVEDGIHYRLLRPLVSVAPDGSVTAVPAGFYTDLASLPDIARIGVAILLLGWWLGWLWLFLLGGVIVWFADWLDNKAKTDREAILHDWRYWCQDRSFWFANAELFRTMRQRNPWLLCAIYWVNLTLFGYFAWKSDAKRKRKVKAGQVGFL